MGIANPRRDIVVAFHQEQLPGLLEHVRSGFMQLEAGEIDEFELDDLIHQYKKAATLLWAFCEGGRGSVTEAASAIEYLREREQRSPDWWSEGGTSPHPLT